MRKVLLAFWLLLPAAGAAYHYGPGQRGMVLDDVDSVLFDARQLAAEEDWTGAIEKYDVALALLPEDTKDQNHRVRLAKAKAQMLAAQLPLAHVSLEGLLDEVSADSSADPGLVSDVRSTLASSQYYMTWLMRLEGLPRETWMPLVEGARQNYRLLAETAGDEKTAEMRREDLDSTIRLARIDLSDLQGLPPPTQ